MIHRRVGVLIGSLLFSFYLLAYPPNSYAAVVINEIFPKSADIKQTWIELYNTGPESVSLDRWKLENTNGGSSTLNASAIIASNGFLTFYQTQTDITFDIQGDTLRLLDEKNNLIDSQSYPGILGYNTSMGRSKDGGAGWVVCTPPPTYTATPNTSNKCPPAPTNTPTPVPTIPLTNASTPIINDTSLAPTIPTTIPTPTIDPSSRFAFPDVLGDTAYQTPTPTAVSASIRQSDEYQKIWTVSLIGGVGLGLLIMIIGLYKTFRSRTN